ncbi:MAG: VanZ family protein [Firmicutes bacterium]|nr:VanZ family protein [Bacillota bacterium]
MKKKIGITVPAAVLLLALYMLIFGFSAQDGETSGSISQLVSEKCVELFNRLSGGHWTESFMESLAEYFEHPLRKLAHFSEYACMGILLYFLWSQWIRRGRKLYALILLWIFCSAGLDELHQLFVPGRYGSFADVLLDTCGGSFGMLVCVGCGKLRERQSRRMKDSGQRRT